VILFHFRGTHGRTLLAAGLYRTATHHKLVLWIGERARVLSVRRLRPNPAEAQ